MQMYLDGSGVYLGDGCVRVNISKSSEWDESGWCMCERVDGSGWGRVAGAVFGVCMCV